MEFSKEGSGGGGGGAPGKQRSGVGSCAHFFWLAVAFDAVGVAVLFTGVFADLRFFESLLYLGAIIIFVGLLWWVSWFTGNETLSEESLLAADLPPASAFQALQQSVSHRFSLTLGDLSSTCLDFRRRGWPPRRRPRQTRDPRLSGEAEAGAGEIGAPPDSGRGSAGAQPEADSGPDQPVRPGAPPDQPVPPPAARTLQSPPGPSRASFCRHVSFSTCGSQPAIPAGSQSLLVPVEQPSPVWASESQAVAPEAPRVSLELSPPSPGEEPRLSAGGQDIQALSHLQRRSQDTRVQIPPRQSAGSLEVQAFESQTLSRKLPDAASVVPEATDATGKAQQSVSNQGFISVTVKKSHPL